MKSFTEYSVCSGYYGGQTISVTVDAKDCVNFNQSSDRVFKEGNVLKLQGNVKSSLRSNSKLSRDRS